MEKGVRPGGEEGDDEIVLMVAELTVQKEYLRARLTELREETGDSRPEDSSLLREEIRTLNEEIRETKEAQRAAEDDLAKLRSSHSELESRASDISSQLGEALQKIEHETRARDDKYADLDSKFQRLHKRAKQKIQEIQKEKDDMEARLQEVQEKSEEDRRELEVTLQQANETLRSVDLEKQQLRTANSKLRENMDELCRALEAKQNSFEELQQSLMKKEQLLEETQKLLHAAEDKKQAMISDLSSKHQKIVESLQAQLAEALSERSKATETTASLQALIIEKDSRIAELDAASTGEIARLRAAVESAKQELNHLKNDHEREIESWEATCQTLRNKLEASESSRLSFEIEAAKTKSQLELELSLLNQTLNSREADLAAAKEEISRLDSEFSSYKVRAHALLQKKDAELVAARDHELIKAHEEAVKDAEREAAVALSERNNALCDLQDALVKYDNDIAARDGALAEAHQRIKSFSMKVNSLSIQHQSEKELWQKNLQDLEESWNLRYRALEAQASMHDVNDLRNQLEELRLKHRKLKEEHKSFCDISDHTMEEKEKEIMRLKEENGNLSRSLEQQRQRVGDGSFGVVNLQKQQDPQGSSLAAADQQILLLARQQAQREEELTQSQRHILALQEEIEELERENRLHSQQEAMLKEELRNVERKHKREGVDMTYLKNVILKLLETGEVEALLPVVGMLLQFSPEEMSKCQQVYSSTGTAATAAPLATSAEVAATPRSLFSRFTFS